MRQGIGMNVGIVDSGFFATRWLGGLRRRGWALVAPLSILGMAACDVSGCRNQYLSRIYAAAVALRESLRG